MYNRTIKSENGKLVRGIIYDDINTDVMQYNMLKEIDDNYISSLPKSEHITSMIKEMRMNNDEAVQYYNTMSAITALTRLNLDTGVCHNLIIPKESLSVNLVKELEKVDLAEGLYDAYVDKTYEEKNPRETPKVFDSSEYEKDETLLEFSNRCSDNAKFILNGRMMSKEEFFNDPKVINAFRSYEFNLF